MEFSVYLNDFDAFGVEDVEFVEAEEYEAVFF